MGMAASQARLLSITARLTNNENTGQAVSYSKQRLADQTQQITNEYNEALDATKLTVLTGFNGAVANYEDISYNLMTGMRMAENNKQYVVTDTKGRILVTEQLADAYTKSRGNYNQFLANLGYSQADITVQVTSNDENKKAATEQQIHEAWDKYFASVGINKFMPEHDFGFSFSETAAYGTTREDVDNSDNYNIGDGYVGYKRTAGYEQAIDENGQLMYSEYEIEAEETTVNVQVLDGYEQAKDAEGHLKYENLKRAFGSSTSKEIAYVAAVDAGHAVLLTTYPNIDKKPCYVLEGYDSYGMPKYNVYVDKNDTNDYSNGDSSHYNVIKLSETTDAAEYNKYLKYVPQFTSTSVADISKPILDYSKPIYKAGEEKTVKNVKKYNTESEPIYDYSKPIYVKDGSGNQIYDPINYEGTTQESRDLFDYAMAITEAYLRVNNEDGTSENGVPFKQQYDLDAFKSPANLDNNNTIKYYRNLYDQMQTCGYFTYTDTPVKSVNDKEHYKYSEEGKGTNKVAKNPLKDNYTFEAALRDGSLRLKYYSSTDKAFKSTTISEDNCIQEVPDERAIAKAESKYTQDMADLESKDKRFDLELKKLDTEHKALETEYESVKNVIDKNVESSFKIFS